MPKNENSSGFVRFMHGLGITLGALITLLFFVILLLIVAALFIPSHELTAGNVAVVPITGTISTDGSGNVLEDHGTDSETIVGWIKDADKDEKTRAIVLMIDSPGGSPVATDEIARAVKEASKPVVAVIRESGASGAFWIATAADYVFADPMSLTGSIGVVGSRLEFAGLLKDYNVTYRRLVAGKYKDAGSRWKEMTPEEEALFQKMLDEIHARFIAEVAANRKLPLEKVQALANGFVYTGAQAKELGLIDALGNKDDALNYVGKRLNITAEPYEFKPTTTFLKEIVGLSSYNIGKGIGTSLTAQATTDSVRITT